MSATSLRYSTSAMWSSYDESKIAHRYQTYAYLGTESRVQPENQVGSSSSAMSPDEMAGGPLRDREHSER